MKKATCTALCTVLLVALAGSVIHFRRASEGKDTDIMSSPSASNAAPDIRQMELDDYMAAHLQYSYNAESKRSGIDFFELAEIEEFTDSNSGCAYIDKTGNTLTIMVMISASINTGAPSGPKQEILFDLDSGEILEKSTEDYTGELREGGVSVFPDLPDERWIEISDWFKDVILTAEKEYAKEQS